MATASRLAAVETAAPAAAAFDFAARIRSILPDVAAIAEQAEQDRRIPDSLFAKMVSAGVFKVFQPRRWGGFELPPMSFFNAVYDIAEVYPSAGWVFGVIGPHSWEVASMSEQAQMEVWGNNPDTIISSSFAPMGKVRRVDGGYVLDGTWKYSSGSAGCSWVLVGGAVPQEAGPPQIRNFLLPRADYEIVDTWHVMGLKGTGSNDIVIKDVFVPDHRSNSMEDLYYSNNPGREKNDGPLYKLPFLALFSPLLSFAAMGAAKGAHNHFVDYIASAAGKLNKGYDLAEEGSTHLRIARSLSDIESSKMMLASLLDEMYDHAVTGREIPILLRKRIRFESTVATDRAATAVTEIFKACGTSVVNRGNVIQRHMLDVLTARTHVGNIVERAATLYAREALGVAGPPKGPADFNC